MHGGAAGGIPIGGPGGQGACKGGAHPTPRGGSPHPCCAGICGIIGGGGGGQHGQQLFASDEISFKELAFRLIHGGD